MMSDRWRKIVTRFHPEGIPWPGSAVYNALSRTRIFLRHYEIVARDVAAYGTARRLLDIGTGPGQLLAAMRKTLPNTRLVGLDISRPMVWQAMGNLKIERHDPNIDLAVADANALPFADASFDRAVSTGSLHHWKNPGQALSEIHRVLKDAGLALMYDLVRDMPKAVCQKIRTQFGGFRLALLWLHSFEEPFLNVGEMEALGKKSNFMVEKVKFTGALCCLILRKGQRNSKSQTNSNPQ